jgi:hypothetical protein
VTDVRTDDLSRREEMSEPQAGVGGDGVPQALGTSGGRRHVLGSLAAAVVAVLASLGWGEPSAAAKRGLVTGESHRKGDGHPHGKRGKRGEAGPGGPAGSPGSPGEKGDKGDKGDAGNQGDKGDKGDQGDTGTQGEPGPTAGKMFWARVSVNGTLVSSYGVDSVSSQVGGIYVVRFTDANQDFGHCAITALAESFDTAIDVQSNFGTIIFRLAVNGRLASDSFSCIVVCPAT